jgi:uncharacterized GH25 family protein
MSGSVYGNVVRAESGEPVPGATVLCGKGGASKAARSPEPSMSALTDSAGWFRFENLPQGEWLLRALGASRTTLPEATVRVFDNALSEMTIEVASTTRRTAPGRAVSGAGNPRAVPRGKVRGQAIDAASGAPIAYATILVVSGPGAVPDHVYVSSSEGWFELDEVPVGDWLLRARDDTGATGIATVRVLPNAISDMTIAIDGLPTPHQRPTGDIEPVFDLQGHAMKGRLIGHVIYAEGGSPVANATVTILRGAGPVPDIAPITNSDGSFALDDLPAGSWLLRAVGPGGETGLVQVSVRPGSITDAVIKVTVSGNGNGNGDSISNLS